MCTRSVVRQAFTMRNKRLAWLPNDYEHDQLRISICPSVTRKICYHKIDCKDFHYHEKRQWLLEICFFKDFQGAEIIGPNHFKQGCCKNNNKKPDTFCKISNYDAKFSLNLQIQELALKLYLSDSGSKSICLTFANKCIRQNLYLQCL